MTENRLPLVGKPGTATLWHFWTKMPRGNRAHRYLVQPPIARAHAWGLFWSRTAAIAFASGERVPVHVRPMEIPSYATRVGRIPWNAAACFQPINPEDNAS